ncbi:hypothetical protein Rhopal_000609-T1 [Rhodotorula paludigena]|uniref:Peptidase A1 domain-containing protein n=1 Tax=Rhodotorula paludigena TaxID=86838 RepID=A0AAV5GB54_9BASI|nr:hypothetical protein Rhopal_000609-T1 [Rhodotorula paludigena]
MIGFVALAPLAILASSSLVDALPSPVRLEGSVPTVTRRDGTLDEALFARNLDATFQKLEDVNPGPADVEPQVGRKARRALPLKKRCDKQAQVSLEARQYANFVPVSFGSSGQTLSLILDTGSTDLVVQSTTANGAPAFDTSKSTSYKATDEAITFSYVDGSMSGIIAQDKISVGGLSVDKQTFGLVESDHSAGVSGVFGLGMPGQAKIAAPSVMDSLFSAGKLDSKSFGLALGSAQSGKGSLILGGMDEAYAKSPYMKLPVWTPFGRIVVVNSRTAAGGLGVATFIDSGSTVSYLPKDVVKTIHSAIPGAKLYDTITQGLNGVDYTVERWQYPCNAQIGQVGLSFDGGRRQVAQIQPDTFNFGYADEDSKEMCASTFFGVDIELGGVKAGILGANFLRNVYAKFDFGSQNEQPTISFWNAHK